MRIAVVGAGPAGMTAAWQLRQGGAEVSVFEAGSCVGGLSRSFDLWGQRVDLGPHRFFSADQRVNQLWLDIVGSDYVMIDRLTRLYYKGRFFHYPLKPLNALWNMGVFEAAACLASYAKEQLHLEKAADTILLRGLRNHESVPDCTETTFESWMVRRFGRRLFEMFFKSYSEKLWGIPCSELSADFAAQRIKNFSLREAVISSLTSRRGKQHETLMDRFAYPLAGTGSVYEKMADRLGNDGGVIHLKCPVQRVMHDGFSVQGLELQDGRIEKFDHIVSTMPLTTLVRGLNTTPIEVQAAAEELQFRNTLLVYLQVDSDSLFEDQWLYIHAPELKMGRVTNFRNWATQLHGKQKETILAVEFWCNSDDPEWAETDQPLIDLASRELRSTGLLGDKNIMAGHVVRVSHSYPIYRQGYRKNVERIVDYLHNFRGLTPIGRYGAFQYVNQDHSILMGILAAENILDSRAHDLWSVAASRKTYQEDALITETGLVTHAG